MDVLVINTGSSSLKYQLFDMDNSRVLMAGIVERIGEARGIITHKKFSRSRADKTRKTIPIPDHQEAMHLVAGLITHTIDAVGHRVVHFCR